MDGKNSLSGKDILGDFFEGIIRNGFKQSKGQFFTHINIVRFMLYALQTDKLAIKRIKEDKEIPYMIDPSAGSGTFLIEYMKFITENMKYRNRNADGYNADLGTARAVKDKVFLIGSILTIVKISGLRLLFTVLKSTLTLGRQPRSI